jgi:chorismate mutase
VQPIRNEGVIIGGNASVSGPVAAGRHARAEQYQVGSEAVAREIAALREVIRAHGDQLADQDGAASDVAEVERETTQPQPDPDRILAVLNRLAARVSAVGAVAAAVDRLRDAVT